ncbi:MAG: NAD-dependent protein deacetylase [Bradymonadaceae bacterium]
MSCTSTSFDALVDLVSGRSIVALTGAGCSTESGIPDYRGPKTREKARNPIQYLEFVRHESARRRYWARSALGWPRLAAARHNACHDALATLEEAGCVRGIITQNVDRLHHAAGSRRVIELHGALAQVICLACRRIELRNSLQTRIERLNPGWVKTSGKELAPDGDMELPEEVPEDFRIPSCRICDGILKPHVVFFGENVPRPIVDSAWSLLNEAEVLLVAGSSLTVFSGYRFVREAERRALPVAIINLGETRGDKHACVRLDARLGEAMPRLANRLTS